MIILDTKRHAEDLVFTLDVQETHAAGRWDSSIGFRLFVAVPALQLAPDGQGYVIAAYDREGAFIQYV